MAKTKKKVEPEFPKVIETFKRLGDWQIIDMKQQEPSAFNGWIRFKKYRITIEEIEEPVEVLGERLEKLWVECDNHHHWIPLENAAKSIGYSFKGERGSQKTKK